MISAKVNATEKIEKVGVFKLGSEIVANRRGMVEINFRGPSGTFPMVSAVDLLTDGKSEDETNRNSPECQRQRCSGTQTFFSE